ncbi:hypothetical protein M4D51_07945 [Microbacterium sp. p3-SID338]|uniref:hypothetical protein n=1 Tax=Microbacterium sp. p3-SID338 TaxID=2916214 RepID=UPI0021A6876B|nr:hypothetical protein [Microbacterium sp. p3-SID338]MCT1395657.1 hypothetical protein [Microbacterium sp. p3-SID338]
MSNPGFELLALYRSWRDRLDASRGNRSMTTHLAPESREGMAEFRKAYALLVTIDEILRGFEAEGKRAEPFRRQLDGWARVPLSLQAGWSQNVMPDHLVTESTLDQLESFGAYLEGKVLVLDSSQHTNLRSLIDQADVLLNQEGFDPILKQYLRRLIASVRYALDDEQAGKVFDFEDAVQRLWVAFNAAAERAPEQQKTSWRDLLQQIFVGVVSGGAVEGASIVVGSITAGG